MRLLHLETNERKNLALWIMLAGMVFFAVYATVAFFWLQSHLGFIFWMGVIAHIQIFSIMAGFIAQLVKRRISAGKQGIEISDVEISGIVTHKGEM